MKSFNYDELNFVLQQLCEKRDVLQDQIDNNTLMMQELEDSFDGSVYIGENDDDLFSPRKKIGNKSHREKVERDCTAYQQQNEQNIFDRNKINILIETIQRVIAAEENSEQAQDLESDPEVAETPTISDEQDTTSIYKELSRISRKVTLCKKIITQDPHRAKLELDNIQKKVCKLMDSVSCETNQ